MEFTARQRRQSGKAPLHGGVQGEKDRRVGARKSGQYHCRSGSHRRAQSKDRANSRGRNRIAGGTDGGENKAASTGISERHRAGYRGGAQQAHAEAKTTSRGRTIRAPHGERCITAIKGYFRPRPQRLIRAVAESRAARQKQRTGIRDGERYACRLPGRVRHTFKQVTSKEDRPIVQNTRQRPRRQVKLNNRIQGERLSSKLHNNGE